MSNKKQTVSTYHKLVLFLAAFFIPLLGVFAQNQENIPKPRGPIDFSETSNVVIFLVIPVIIIGFYFAFRKRIRNRRKP